MEARQFNTTTSPSAFPTANPSADHESSLRQQSTPQVYTYHCLCTHLLLATTTPLPRLPRRASSSTSDGAYILPLPPPPSPSSPEHDSDSSDSPEPASKYTALEGPSLRNIHGSSHYALLLNPSLSQKPQIHRLPSGFEKRYLWRCGRCKLVVGYQLDKGQYPGMDKVNGRREDVVYVLPGGVQTTQDMASGKEVPDKDLVLGGEG